MFGVAFEWHNYGKSTIGNRRDIERVPIEKLQAFYRKPLADAQHTRLMDHSRNYRRHRAAGQSTNSLRDKATCRGHTAYLCGPPPMVEAALKTLMRKRLFPKDIYREDFFDPSDKATGGVRSPLMRT